MQPTEPIVLRVVQVIIDKLGVDQNLLSYKTSFSDDLGVDSLDEYELLMAIEKEFELKINEDMMERLTTVGAIIDYIDDKVSKQTKHRADIIIMNKPKGDNTTHENLVQAPEYK
jgi:acyl carrier protein